MKYSDIALIRIRKDAMRIYVSDGVSEFIKLSIGQRIVVTIKERSGRIHTCSARTIDKLLSNLRDNLYCKEMRDRLYHLFMRYV
jgi:hypothetical protein